MLSLGRALDEGSLDLPDQRRTHFGGWNFFEQRRLSGQGTSRSHQVKSQSEMVNLENTRYMKYYFNSLFRKVVIFSKIREQWHFLYINVCMQLYRQLLFTH